MSQLATTNPATGLLRAHRERFETRLPVTRKHDADKFRIAVEAAVARSRSLASCLNDPKGVASFLRAVEAAYVLGLEPGDVHGHFYLVPFKGEVTAIIGYRGLVDLAYRSQRVRSIEAHLVYKNEVFEYDRGTGHIRHPYAFDVDRDDKNIVGAYAVARVQGIDQPIVAVLSRSEIDKRKRQSASSKNSGSPWNQHYAAMARKTAIRALLSSGLVPLSAETEEALSIEKGEEIRMADAEVVDTPKLAPTRPTEESIRIKVREAMGEIGMSEDDLLMFASMEWEDCKDAEGLDDVPDSRLPDVWKHVSEVREVKSRA